MRLILFRHGLAGTHDPAQWADDRLRPLTPRGQKRTRQAARGLIKLEKSIDVILTSPLVRAMQTAEILRDEAGKTKIEAFAPLSSGGSLREVIRRLQQSASGASIALVGHEPDLGRLAGRLVLGAETPLPLKKAGACIIGFVSTVRAGHGRLLGFYPPKTLRHLAGKRSNV